MGSEKTHAHNVERKSRRTHKNSKDGCPNCRTNRIKCGEELPSCSNCVKKKIRCGYLDFSPERKEHIRKKNELAKQQTEIELGQYRPPLPNITPRQPLPISPWPSVHPQNPQIPPYYSVNPHQPSIPALDSISTPYHLQNQVLAPRVNSAPFANYNYPPYGYDNTTLHPNNQIPHPAVQQQPFNAQPVSLIESLPPSNLAQTQAIPYQIKDTSNPPSINTESKILANYSWPTSSQPTTKATDVSGAEESSPKKQYRDQSSGSKRKPSFNEISSSKSNSKIDYKKKKAKHERKNSNELLHAQRGARLRSVVYSNLLNDIGYEVEELGIDLPADFTPWDPNDSFDTESFFSSTPFSQNAATNSLEANWSQNESSANNEKHMTGLSDKSCVSRSDIHSHAALPNSVKKTTKFSRKHFPPHLSTIQATPQRKLGGIQFTKYNKISTKTMFPVWCEEDARKLWLDVFQNATIFDLFFRYFINKSVNILLRASDAILNDEIISSPSNSSNSSKTSPGTENEISSPEFFYSPHDLEILKSKSFATYNRTIRELRASINFFSTEYPAQISLFSAWACYSNSVAELNTFCLMLKGGLLLVKKLFNDCQATENSVFSMRREVMMLNTLACHSAWPEYTFEVIENLANEFAVYKAFVGGFISLHEAGTELDDDLREVILSPVFRHDLRQLEKFLAKLSREIYPQVKKYNEYYKSKYNMKDGHDIHFVSPTLIFEMTFEWFKSFTGKNLFYGKDTNPLKKVLYIFYHALAKCLAHVFSPMQSVSFVDACNVNITKVGSKFAKPELLETKQYQLLVPMVRSLFKTIRFFENRSELYGYYFARTSVLDSTFIKTIGTRPPKEWPHQDIIHLFTTKISVSEQQVVNFANTTITADHYPFFDEIKSDSESNNLIHLEAQRQQFALSNEPYIFDYSLGISNYDFNPRAVIDHFISKQVEASETDPFSTEKLASRIDALINSRNLISTAINGVEGTA